MGPVHGAHLGIDDRFLDRQRDPARRAEVVVGRPGTDAAHADARTTAVAAADGHGRAGGKPRRLGGLGRDRAEDLGRRPGGREQIAVESGRGEDLLRPAKAVQVERIGARGVAVVRGELARQPMVDVVLRAEGLVGAAKDVRLLVADPHQFLDRVAGAGAVADDRVELGRIDLLDDPPRLRLGPLIAIEDTRPQGASLAVDGGAAHHLPAQGHAGDLAGVDALE